MTGTIIPLGLGGEGASSLAGFDVIAAELLTEGRAVSLSAARIEAILAKLSAQRAELAAVLVDLQARPLSGDVRIDTVNADLSVVASKGLAQIELLIQQAEKCAVSAR